MANLLGLGVFGTFGQPYGFQQAFNLDVQFNHSLDLDSTEIELFPNTELFAVKREVFMGGYTICFCMYSYVREMNANRSTTFLGSCIVLQHVYIDAEKIYKLLRELHNDLINNTQNVNNNTIQVRQAVNLVVREPANFQSAKFSAKSIDGTPFYSTNVDSGKKYFVQTEHIESASQVVAFFDEALKNYNDTGELYFTFNDKVIDAVIKKGNLRIINWDEFTNYKNVVQQGVVRTKKGIKHSPVNDSAAPVTETKPEAPATITTPVAKAERPVTPPAKPEAPVATPAPVTKPEVPKTAPVQDVPVKATAVPDMPPAAVRENRAEPVTEIVPDIPEPNFPFNGWGEPRGVWPLDETIKRVHEYNRLLKYAKHLKEHNENLQYHIETITEPAISETEATKTETRQTQPSPDERQYGRQQETETDEPEEKEPFYKNQFFLPLVIFGVALLIVVSCYLIFNKHIFRKRIPDTVDTTATTIQPDTSNHAQASKEDTTEAINDTVDANRPQPPAAPQHTADTPKNEERSTLALPQNIKVLSPAANIELTKSEAIVLSRAGVKNKTLPDITNMIFQKFPVNVGEVYKHQFGDYSMNLLMANKNAFQKKGADYICITDTIMHIPAYKTPRIPVAFPK